MMRTAQTALAPLAISLVALSANADTISGKVVDSAGTVSYTHLKLPTILLLKNSVVAVAL